MLNLIVLCRHCYSWVESHSNCPECLGEVCLETADRTDDEFAEVLGQPICELGPIQVDRKDLPSYGNLVRTTTGYLFLPRLHRRLNGAWEGLSSQKIPAWWPFQGESRTSRFLNWLRGPVGTPVTADESTPGPSVMSDVPLYHRLLDSPGAFFVQQRHIKSITVRRRHVKIERPPFRNVTLVDETEDSSLYTSLIQLNSQH